MDVKPCSHYAWLHWMTLAFASVAVLLLWNKSARAQLIPDTTVGTQIVPFDPDTSIIEGGTTVGQNLFHSFESFNIDSGQRIFFLGPDDVNHIFSRVTGGDPSQINGVLGTFGSDANLFLINPSGVVFGSDASLSVQGSFVATTADGVQFGEGGQFNAIDPNADSLLAINPSAFFFSGLEQPKDIISHGNLGVPTGEALLFLGGDVVIDGGQLSSADGRVELGALAANGIVEFSTTPFSLSFPKNTSRGNVEISNDSSILAFNFFSAQNGNVVISANNIDITGDSRIFTGVGPGLDIGDQQVGNVELKATGDITLSDTSFIVSSVLGSAQTGDLSIGQSGDIRITADNLSILSGSALANGLNGSGSTGDIVISVNSRFLLDGVEASGFPSAILNNILPGAEGTSGEIEILAATVELTDGASIFATTSGTGDSGNVSIVANNVEISGGSSVLSDTGGTGNAGDISLTVQDRLVLNGTPEIGSSISSEVESTGIGNGGNIQIDANSLEILNGSFIVANTEGLGNAGDIDITVQDQTVLDGVDRGGVIASEVELSGQGNGGNVEILTDSLTVLNGSQIIAGTEGIGNGGNIIINASDLVVFDGTRETEDGVASSAALSFVGENAQGNGGNVNVFAERLEIINGANIDVGTFGVGRAGDVFINATGDVLLNRGSIIAESLSDSPAGSLLLIADSLLLDDTSFLSTSTNNAVNSGNISLELNELLVLRNNSNIGTNAGFLEVGGDGEILRLQFPLLWLFLLKIVILRLMRLTVPVARSPSQLKVFLVLNHD